MEKLLTISIAAYNVEKFLKKTLSSMILRDEYMSLLEIIIVSDGSKDSTVHIANDYKEKYPDTFVVVDKENGGYGSTINTSIPIAKGRYYKLVDGDDWVDSAELEKLIDFLNTTDADMVLSKYCSVEENSGETRVMDGGLIFDNRTHSVEVLYGHPLPMHFIAIKTSILRDNHIFITEKCFYTDLEYVVKPLLYVHSVALLDAIIYMYRIGRDEQSVSIRSSQKNIEQAIKVTYELSSYCGKISYKDVDKDMRNYILDKVSGSAINKYRILLSFPHERRIKKRIISYDKELKLTNEKVWKECRKNNLVRLLMISGMPFYTFLSFVYRRHLKKKGIL